MILHRYNLSDTKTDRKSRKWHSDARTRAFSLIEVIVAMALVSVSFVTLVGMLTTGLTLLQQGFSTTISSSISLQIIDSVQQTKFSELSTMTNETFYFDAQGDLLTSSQQNQSVYQAYVTGANEVLLPGASSQNTNLVMMNIYVARNPANVPILSWTTPPTGVSVTSYSCLVASGN